MILPDPMDVLSFQQDKYEKGYTQQSVADAQLLSKKIFSKNNVVFF